MSQELELRCMKRSVLKTRADRPSCNKSHIKHPRPCTYCHVSLDPSSQCPPLVSRSGLPLSQTDRFLRNLWMLPICSCLSQNDPPWTYRLQLVNWILPSDHSSPVKLWNSQIPKASWPRVAHGHTIKCYHSPEAWMDPNYQMAMVLDLR